MSSLKHKFKVLTISSLLIFGGTVATNEVISLADPNYQIVYADDIVVNKATEHRMDYMGDVTNPNNPSVNAQNNIYVNWVYLSPDGKTRYLKRIHTSEEWLVWKADKSNQYGGTWVSVGKNTVIPTSTKKNPDAEKNFEAKYGYSYTATPTELANNSSNNKPDSAPNSGAKIKDSEESGVSKKDIEKYNSYLSLGDKPDPSTILASAILAKGGASGVDSANIGFSTLAQYPAPTQATAKIKGKDQTVSVYEYGNLQNSGSATAEGSTTANIIRILSRYGWLTTNNNNEKKTAWYTELMNNISNPVYAVGTIVATTLGVISDALANVFQAVIDGTGTIVGWLLPVKIFGLVTGTIAGVAQADNWFTQVVRSMIELVFGKGKVNTIKVFIGMAIAFAIIISVTEFLIKGKKEGIKSGLLSFRKIVFKLGVWTLGLALLPVLYQLISSGGAGVSAIDNDDFTTGTTFNSEKYFIATNGDLSVLYPDNFEVAKGRYLTNTEIEKNFKPTAKQITEANQKVKNILGSELSAQIDAKNKSKGALDNVVSNKTWNVNDYLTGIESASDYSNQITANKLPSALSWEPDITKNQMTVSVMPTDVGGTAKNIQDITKQGWFIYKGTPVWFDNIADSFNGDSEEKAYVSAGGWMGIKYSPTVYQPKAITRKDTHTYLYGASSNNNEMTLNVANFTFNHGLTLNGNLQAFPKGNSQVKDGEAVKKAKTNNGVSAGKIDDKLDTPKTALTSDNIQWRNAYMVAMFNKYAGTTDNYGTLNNMGFSNQSTMILLQSTYNKSKLSYSGYNTPNSKADNSKAQTKDNVYMPVYTNVGTSEMLSNALSRTSYGLISRAIILYAIMVCIFQYSFGVIIKDSWVYFFRWGSKGSATGLLMIVVTTVYFFMLFQITGLLSSLIMRFVTLTITKLQGESLVATATTFSIGVMLVGIALLTCLRIIKINRRKTSLVSLSFLGLTVLYDTIKDYVERIDVAMYGDNSANKTASEPADTSNTVSGSFRRGGGLLKSAVGSFVGNTLADRADGNVNSGLGEQGEDTDTTSQPSNNNGGFRIPLVPSNNSDSHNDSGLGQSSKLNFGKNAIRGGKLARRVMKLGAIGSLATPVGWATLGYQGMRATSRGLKGIKNSYSRIKDTEFGARIGMNGRKQQLMSRYGLKSDSELASELGTGRIKPRFMSSKSIKQYQTNDSAINKLEKYNLVNADKANAMRKLNTLGRNTPTLNNIRKTVDANEKRKEYVNNSDVKIDNASKAIVLGRSFANGQLFNHMRKTVPQRRQAYLEQQAKKQTFNSDNG